MADKGMKSLAAYQEVNVQGTQRLVECAVKHHVKRFIYLSTIKVNGEKTWDTPFRADDQPRPTDAYSLSKLQAEQILQQTAKRSGMEWVIIRTPLVYGPSVKGNFAKLMALACSGFPLPLRSLKRQGVLFLFKIYVILLLVAWKMPRQSVKFFWCRTERIYRWPNG